VILDSLNCRTTLRGNAEDPSTQTVRPTDCPVKHAGRGAESVLPGNLRCRRQVKIREQMTPPRIKLALSGGGFRATLFHLGVIRFLRDAGLLPCVQRITSVSGGSILAAHLALNWHRYTGSSEEFDAASKELIRFTMADIRGRILRRWLLAWITILPRIFAIPRGRWRLTNMLRRNYNDLLNGATLQDLPTTPELHILCTSMTTGGLCSFDRGGVTFDRDGDEHRIETTTIDVAFAVAASSAFPPLFPPIRVDNRVLMCDLNEFPNAEYLTDGGVFDNLGINRLLALQETGSDRDLIVVSDAEGNFDWALDKPYSSVLARNVRASDMLMRRVSVLQYGLLEPARETVHRIHIGEVVPQADDPQSVPDPGTQRALRNVRTDLDSFSPREVTTIAAHGFAVARRTFFAAHLVDILTPYNWRMLAALTGSGPKQWRQADAQATQSRRARIVSVGDWATWATALSVMLYVGFFLGQFVVFPNFKIDQLQNQNRALAQSASKYIRNDGGGAVIIFVHGIFGDERETWTCPSTSAYWPELLAKDPAFQGFDVYTIAYPSSFFGSGISLTEMAENVFLRMTVDGVFEKHKRVVFVAHDLGGILVQQMLLAHRSVLDAVSTIVNYGVPFQGSSMASMMRFLTNNKMFQAMVPSPALSSIESEWLEARPKVNMYCAYETIPLKGVIVVSSASASAVCNMPVIPLNANHVDLVKPCDRNDESYLVLVNAIKALPR